MFNTAWIDADILPWRIAPVLENESETFVVDFSHEYMETLFNDTKAETNVLVFSWENRDEIYRKLLWNPYKKGRSTKKPRHFNLVTQILKDTYGSYSQKYMEADDLLIISRGPNDVIVTMDKDLNQEEGAIINLRDRGVSIIDTEEAQRCFWTQMICGDSIDNIRGLTQKEVGTANSDRFVGDTTARKIIDKVDIDDLEEFVQTLYPDPDHFNLNFNLLRLWRKPFELYKDGGIMPIQTEEEFIQTLEELRELFAELAGRNPEVEETDD